MNINWLDWVGYIASLIILISLLMSSIIKLRWINLIGSIGFGIYGFLIGSIPTAFMNLGIVAINVYYLAKIYGSKEYFQLLDLKSDTNYLKAFTDFYAEDLKSFFGTSTFNMSDDKVGLYVLRNMVPAGIFIGKKVENDTLAIEMDYAVPAYRDFKLAKYLYEEKKSYFTDLGIKTLTATADSEMHAKYLIKMGFTSSDQKNFTKKLV